MGFSPFGGDFFFAVFPMIFSIGFVAVLGLVVAVAVKGLGEWNKNNHSPVLTVDAQVVAKRTSVSRHHHPHGDDMAMPHSSTSTTYFATFEVESGDRMELIVPGREFGMLAEGDFGRLTFQGTRYKGFDRER